MKLKSYSIILISSAFLLATANVTFFRHVSAIYPWHENADFLISITLFLAAILIFVQSAFCLFLPTRLFVSVCILFSAITGYFTDHFGAVIDIDMLTNVLETNISESSDLISYELLFRLLVLGVFPIVLIWYFPYQNSRLWRRFSLTALMAVTSLSTALLIVYISNDQYASFFRAHKPVRYYTNPVYPIYSIGKLIALTSRSSEVAGYTQLKTDVSIINDQDRELVILVVGETARTDHFSLNGYHRPTNPILKQQDNLISYSKISSCGTSTAISVPCMFAYATRDQFSTATAAHTENILDLLHRAGVNILWRDNNSSSKGVATRHSYQNFRDPAVNPVCDLECRDIGMLRGLQDYIDAQTGDILIVLHQMGSHGPAYYKRYPAEFEYFKPACQSIELSSCSQEELINAYDNSIRYTDFFLSKVINLLKLNSPRFETSMLYVSDHGESLGESGLFLHGLPYSIAPEAQTMVPTIVWVGSSSDIDYPKSLALKDVPNSHDVLFDTLLTLFEVKTSLPTAADKPLLHISGEH